MRAIITGGAGFIGTNLTRVLVREGHQVVILDNLSRPGTFANRQALLGTPDITRAATFVAADVRDAESLASIVAAQQPDAVIHLAAQVAVTDSVARPAHDFDVNARGTLNVLEAVRLHAPHAHVLFSSTNKVYGSLARLATEQTPNRYVLTDYPHGIHEDFPANAETPYGCSKLTAELYVREYARTYGVRTTAFRMSCIYGRWQNGTVDQGWVGWLTKAALRRERITIYGDGYQVRDLLHVDDLIVAMLAVLHGGAGNGEAYNIGGGPEFSVSVWTQFGVLLEELTGLPTAVAYDDARPGDQKVYISDIRRAIDELSWKPSISPRQGLADLITWLRSGESEVAP